MACEANSDVSRITATWKKVLAENGQHPEGRLCVEVQSNQEHGRDVVEGLAVTNLYVAQAVGGEDVAQHAAKNTQERHTSIARSMEGAQQETLQGCVFWTSGA